MNAIGSLLSSSSLERASPVRLWPESGGCLWEWQAPQPAKSSLCKQALDRLGTFIDHLVNGSGRGTVHSRWWVGLGDHGYNTVKGIRDVVKQGYEGRDKV